MRALDSARMWSIRKAEELGYNVGTGLRKHDGPTGDSTVAELRRRAISDSATYFEPFAGSLSIFATTEQLHGWVAREVIPGLPNGLFLEFGYYLGQSASRLAPAAQQRPDRPTYFAFDAFEGLRDAWSSVGASSGAFDLGGRVPQPVSGVSLVVGWVEDTLRDWLEGHEGLLSFVHMDLDVYPPTRYALELLRPRMQSGTVVLFDELHGFPGWRDHEFRALQETFAPDDYEVVAIGPEQALIRIA